MGGYLTDEVVNQVCRVVSDAGYRTQTVEHNYEVARDFFSYSRVEEEFQALFAKPELICNG
jgi:hypothetical protein